MTTDGPTIWQSDCLRATQHSAHKFMVYDKESAPGFNALIAKVILRGEESDPAKLPKSMHIKHPEDDHAFFPDYLRMGFPVVSERFVELLKEFDIGKTQFLPIDLYQSDRETLRPDKYFIMAIQSQKSGWVQEKSASNAASKIGPGWWNYRTSYKDDYIAVSASAVKGADLWVDPVLQGCLFFSDELCRAIKASTMRPVLDFWRCKVVDV